jgi:GNAT superfamily N-acetyltransferase
MKIGRLAVNDSYKGQNIGRFVLDYLKELFIENNRTGCKFITVDGYRASLKFYEKNDFKYLTTEDEFEDTRLMFFNLSDML